VIAAGCQDLERKSQGRRKEDEEEKKGWILGGKMSS
jgi:hypothetical protein